MGQTDYSTHIMVPERGGGGNSKRVVSRFFCLLVDFLVWLLIWYVDVCGATFLSRLYLTLPNGINVVNI